MADTIIRVASKDGYTWELFTPKGRRVEVVRWERAPGETASRRWTKRMSRRAAIDRIVEHTRIDGWRFSRE